jgi:pyridoxal phosphate enzyme (YggS family)
MITKNLAKIHKRIDAVKCSQKVTLIAVSKTKPVADIQQAINFGQRHFGENYLQEALGKIDDLKNQDLIWHFIGPIQSNKTAKIANNFDWVHSVDRLKIAKRLNNQRLKELQKLNILLQINIDNEPTKSGVSIAELESLIPEFENLQNITLRGFMCIPNKNNPAQSFAKMKKIMQQYPNLDTLSMGMSADMELAIENGATFIRIGSDIFGKRI